MVSYATHQIEFAEHTTNQIVYSRKRSARQRRGFNAKYYIAYYKALKGNMNSSIPTLEAQIAFLRSILPVIFLYLATSYCWLVKIGHGYCLFIFITIIILIGCIALIWHLQDKLHQLVWEDAYYAELIDKSVTPTTNNP